MAARHPTRSAYFYPLIFAGNVHSVISEIRVCIAGIGWRPKCPGLIGDEERITCFQTVLIRQFLSEIPQKIGCQDSLIAGSGS
jgi:hypothetical protein